MAKKSTPETVEGLPVSGYTAQPVAAIHLVNENKAHEERLLRRLEQLGESHGADAVWLAFGRQLIEQGFMAINRSIFKPERVKLPEDTGIEPTKVG